MNSRRIRASAALAASAMLVTGLTACTTDDGSDTPTPGATGGETGEPIVEEVTISVGYQPPADQAEQRAAFDQQVLDFEAAYPHITVEATTDVYDRQTFQTLLAGGTLPTVFSAPLTEPASLIANQQLADITDAVTELGLLNDLNPDLVALVTGEDGQIYAVPDWAYAMGVSYNRDLYEEAGLDPDSPPLTWEEFREHASTIDENTDAKGVAILGAGNCGGWTLAAMLYSFGGRLVDEEGTTAVFADGPELVEALQLIHDMRWIDDSVAENILYDCDSTQPDFAAGRFALTLKGDYLPATQQYGMEPESFGYAGMPTWQDGPRATLTGGGVSFISPLATEEQKVAGLQWIQYTQLNKFFDEQVATTQAQAAFDDGAVFEIPGISPVGQDQYETYLGWIEPYNNLNHAHWQSYLDTLTGTEAVPEPPFEGQQIYADLDTVIQAVLSDQNADIEQLVADSQDRVNAILERG